MSDTMRDSNLNELAKVFAASYASPHHITFTLDGLKNLIAQAAQSQPAPPVPSSVQEIMRLMNPYMRACVKVEVDLVTGVNLAQLRHDRDQCDVAFKPLQTALTALVEKNHELQFSLDGVNAMRRPLTDLETRKPWFTAQNEDDFSNEHRIWLSGFRRAEASHGIEPEQGESHER